MNLVVAYCAVLLIFVALDLIWLGRVATQFYKTELEGLMADTFNLPAAVAFYVIYPLGVIAFVVLPALAQNSAAGALLWGAFLGFFAYATYDLTNLATLRKWPIRLVLVDMLWGTALTAVAACGGYLSASVT